MAFKELKTFQKDTYLKELMKCNDLHALQTL